VGTAGSSRGQLHDHGDGASVTVALTHGAPDAPVVGVSSHPIIRHLVNLRLVELSLACINTTHGPMRGATTTSPFLLFLLAD
jgi:hypothetical protein